MLMDISSYLNLKRYTELICKISSFEATTVGEVFKN